MRGSRPPAATLGSADPDGADVVAAAPCNVVRVLSYGVTLQLRAPSAETRQGGRDALRYGVSFATTRSQQLAEGRLDGRPQRQAAARASFRSQFLSNFHACRAGSDVARNHHAERSFILSAESL